MSHLRRSSESSLLNKSQCSSVNYYRLWVTKHPNGVRPVRTRSSFEFPCRPSKGNLKGLTVIPFLGPTMEEEESRSVADDDSSGVSGDEAVRKRSLLWLSVERVREKSGNSRSTSGLKILMKRLSLSLLKTRSFSRTRSVSVPTLTLDHPGPSRLDNHALVFGDENQEKIDERSADFYKTFFPSLMVD
ncbi:hypothetical protein PSTT_10720 [Puccinia striiformis]|uniref:Uncharacterized protein n=1 Tax=Puccinia striiformis TaxID=27350 RepID=A0A2S4V3B0_9BASI|nr:hypothetical protein PSTT_10720 [Puccinia striiformis]